MALTSSNRCSSLRIIPIINDDLVIMCPSDLVGYDNRGKNGLDWVNWSSENQYQTSTSVYFLVRKSISGAATITDYNIRF